MRRNSESRISARAPGFERGTDDRFDVRESAPRSGTDEAAGGGRKSGPRQDCRERSREQWGLKLNQSSLSEWFKGKVVPNDPRYFALLVYTLTGSRPSDDLRRLYDMAQQESRIRRGMRPGAAGGSDAMPVRSELRRLPRIDVLHYVNAPRLNPLLAAHGLPSVPGVPAPGSREMMGFAYVTQSIVTRLAKVELPVRLLTPDLDLRSLQEGDLLLFDRPVHTRNGRMPGDTTPIELDLNKDPLVYIKTRGVRIVMPYDPAFITTSTAYFDFMAGRTRMLGMCVIKRRGRPGDAPHVRRRRKARNSGEVEILDPLKKPKVQFVASPLFLGLSSYRERDPELNRRVEWERRLRKRNAGSGRALESATA